MSPDERLARWRKLRREIGLHDVSYWRETFLAALTEADPSRQVFRAAS